MKGLAWMQGQHEAKWSLRFAVGEKNTGKVALWRSAYIHYGARSRFAAVSPSPSSSWNQSFACSATTAANLRSAADGENFEGLICTTSGKLEL